MTNCDTVTHREGREGGIYCVETALPTFPLEIESDYSVPVFP